MAAIDTWLVAADLLQGPNAVLNAVSPGGLPRLQFVSFGSAVMGFGDLFIAAALGALLARNRRLQLAGAALAAISPWPSTSSSSPSTSCRQRSQSPSPWPSWNAPALSAEVRLATLSQR